MDMDRSPRRRRGDRSSAHANRPADAGLERLKPRREAWQCEMPVTPLGQEWRGMTAAGIEMAGASC